MPEEVQTTAVNSPAVEVASATTATQTETVTPPAGEKPVTESTPENKVPYSRFSEVIDQRNKEKETRVALETRLKELEAKVSGRSQGNDIADAEVKRLVTKLGMSEDAAREVVSATQNVARAERGEVEARLHMYEVDAWTRQLADKHKDFKDLQPAMEKEFSSLDPQEQQYIVSSPKRLEMFYKSIKADLAEFVAKEAFEKGSKAAYDTKAQKQAISSVPGSAAQPQKGELTIEKIRNMPISEYKTRQAEINAWVTSNSRR